MSEPRIPLRQPKLARHIDDPSMSLLLGGALDARLRELILMHLEVS